MAKEVVVTHEGYKKLEEELDTLKTVKRSERRKSEGNTASGEDRRAPA